MEQKSLKYHFIAVWCFLCRFWLKGMLLTMTFGGACTQFTVTSNKINYFADDRIRKNVVPKCNTKIWKSVLRLLAFWRCVHALVFCILVVTMPPHYAIFSLCNIFIMQYFHAGDVWKLNNITSRPITNYKGWEPLEFSMVFNPDPSQLSLLKKRLTIFYIVITNLAKKCVLPKRIDNNSLLFV